MKIVIDTEKLHTTPYYAKNCVVTMEDIIRCGTPLPKEHEKHITKYLIDNVFRNEEYYMLHDEETLSDMIWNLMEIIASLHNEYYKAVHGEYYDYMFHWVNKMNCGSIIDDIFKKENERNDEKC